MGDDGLRGECHKIVDQLLRRYRWSLLTAEEFVDKLFARAQLEQVTQESHCKNLALNIYSATLHSVCTSPGRDLEKGFREVGYYLFSAIGKDYHADEIKEIIVADALARIWIQIDTCQSPGTFIRFCLYGLQHAKTEYIREQLRLNRGESWPEGRIDDSDETNLIDSALIQSGNLPEIDIGECIELRKKILNQFAKLYQRFPRAKRQLEALFYYYFVELGTEEIAHRLETTVNEVYVLLSRGRKHLRTVDEFMELLQAFRANCKD